MGGRPQTPAWDGGLNLVSWSSTGTNVKFFRKNSREAQIKRRDLGEEPGEPYPEQEAKRRPKKSGWAMTVVEEHARMLWSQSSILLFFQLRYTDS